MDSVLAAGKTAEAFIDSMALSAALLDGRSVVISTTKTNLHNAVNDSVATAKLAGSSTGCVEYEIHFQEGVAEEIYTDANIFRPLGTQSGSACRDCNINL